VEHEASAGDGAEDGVSVTDVDGGGVDVEPVEVLGAAAGLHGGGHRGTSPEQRTYDGRADEAGTSGDDHPVAGPDGEGPGGCLAAGRRHGAGPPQAHPAAAPGVRRRAPLAMVRPNSTRCPVPDSARVSTSSSASTK